MKKALFLLTTALLIISSCSLFSPNPANITEVEEYSASDMKDSGATDNPKSEDELIQAFASVDADNDDLLKDIDSLLSDGGDKSAISQRALKFAKSLSSSLESQLEEIQQSFEDFPTTKKLDETISLSGEDLGTYLTLTKGQGTLTATAKTSDGSAIEDDARNLKSLSAEATLQIQIDPTSALASASSAIKDIRMKLNAGGKGSLSTKTVNDTLTPDKITLEYAESFGFGLSLNANGKGGKIIIKEDASFSGSIDYSTIEASSENPEELAALFVPQITIIVKIYNDNDNETFSHIYESVDEFAAAFDISS